MADKKFYWIKLKNTMFTSDAVDFLMSQEDGAKYIVLYQMLCLETIKTNGELVRQIGEVIIPYDVDKIKRDCKYFDRNTIVIALELFKKLGLVYMQDSGYLRITNYDSMVGSECESAQRVRDLRARNKEIESLQCNALCNENVTIDKDIDKEKDKDKEKEVDIDIVSSKPKEQKHQHGTYKNILLTDREYEALKNEYENYEEAIEYLSEYKEMKSIVYKSDYLAIRKWVFDAIKRDNVKKEQMQQMELKNKLNKEKLDSMQKENKSTGNIFKDYLISEDR